MGQQQLLLVILVTIIVGIATVVAINVFDSSAKTANRDAVRNDALDLGVASQAYFIKPKQLGGGGNSFSGINFGFISFPYDTIFDSKMTVANLNGTYELTSVTDSQFVIKAYPASDPAYVKAPPAADSPLELVVKRSDMNWK